MKKIIFLLAIVTLTLATSNAGYYHHNPSVSGGNSFDNYYYPGTLNVGPIKANFFLSADSYISSTIGTSAKAYIGVESEYKQLKASAVSTQVGWTNVTNYWPSGWEPVWTIFWGAALYSYTGTTATADVAASW